MLKDDFIALMEKKAKEMVESLSDAELKTMYDRYLNSGGLFFWHTIAAEMGKRGLIPDRK